MNLDRCTPTQHKVVTSSEGALMVSAGAGSGKTFTLTQRVAFALTGNETTEPTLSSVDQILAITFTKKAALELKNRIKKLLIEEGLYEEALKVDNAWVSTIHGMASRILRENAFEIGIDPAFELIDDAKGGLLLDLASEHVLAHLEDEPSPAIDQVLEIMPLVGSGPYSQGARENAERIVKRAKAMPYGFEGIDATGVMLEPAALLRSVCEQAEVALAYTAQWSKLTKTKQKLIDSLKDALEAAHTWLSTHEEGAFGSDTFDLQGYCHAFYQFPVSTGSLPAADKEYFQGWRAFIASAERELCAAVGVRYLEGLLDLAKRIQNEYASVKGVSNLDNDDLLSLCARALNNNPDIEQRLRQQFKMIMVDEFQDTDKVQVNIIKHLSGGNFENVCTVGDAQQSIYRFRGADVNVFNEYKRNLATTHGSHALVEMGKNFRSHADVLAFVERIFAQPSVFGESFLRLEAGGAVNNEADPLFEGSIPRVALHAFHRPTKGVSTARLAHEQARAVAEYFAELRDAGAPAGDMVLLLGKMTNADVYAQALREVGLSSVIAGGSVFGRLPEPQLMLSLLSWAVHEKDTSLLYTILASPLFALSDDALLFLASKPADTPPFKRRSLAEGFFDASFAEALTQSGLSASDCELLHSARLYLLEFLHHARKGEPVKALRTLLTHVGLLDRLQEQGVEGIASAAQYEKALRLLADFEDETMGLSSLVSRFSTYLACAKEPPGVLSGAAGNYVSIMTVHASKGLEFPHVAIADLKDGTSNASSVVVENVGDYTELACSIMPLKEYQELSRKFKNEYKKHKAEENEARAEEIFADPSHASEKLSRLPLGERFEMLAWYAKDQEYKEALRLLYVALTRASKSLFLVTEVKGEDATAYSSAGVYSDVYDAFQWDIGTGITVSQVDYQGSAPARVVCEYLAPEGQEDEEDEESEGAEGVEGNPEDAEGAEAADGTEVAEGANAQEVACTSVGTSIQDGTEVAEEPEPFLLVQRAPVPVAVFEPANLARNHMYSYTSLSETFDPYQFEDEFSDVIPRDDECFQDLIAAPQALAASKQSEAEAGNATALGTAFHRLAQQGIELSVRGALKEPALEALEIQCTQNELTNAQRTRLYAAVKRWFASEEAALFSSFENREAEVPFTLCLDEVYLEGEIDGLAYNDFSHALIIDYKTGGSTHDAPDYLLAKHRLQATCYAYALLKAGFESVDAHFLRIEHVSEANPRNPVIVPYHFEAKDKQVLEAYLLAAYKEARHES